MKNTEREKNTSLCICLNGKLAGERGELEIVERTGIEHRIIWLQRERSSFARSSSVPVEFALRFPPIQAGLRQSPEQKVFFSEINKNQPYPFNSILLALLNDGLELLVLFLLPFAPFLCVTGSLTLFEQRLEHPEQVVVAEHGDEMFFRVPCICIWQGVEWLVLDEVPVADQGVLEVVSLALPTGCVVILKSSTV